MRKIGDSDLVDSSKVIDFHDRQMQTFQNDLDVNEPAPLVRESFGKLPAIRGREVTQSDQDDLADTGERLLNRFRRLATSEVWLERLAHAIDGKTIETRSANAEAAVTELIESVAQASYEHQYREDGAYVAPHFRVALSAPDYVVHSGPAMNVIPERQDFSFSTADYLTDPTVLISNDLGFRENQVAAAAGFALSIIDHASRNEISGASLAAENDLLAVLLAPISDLGQKWDQRGSAASPQMSGEVGEIRMDGRVISAELRHIETLG